MKSWWRQLLSQKKVRILQNMYGIELESCWIILVPHIFVGNNKFQEYGDISLDPVNSPVLTYEPCPGCPELNNAMAIYWKGGILICAGKWDVLNNTKFKWSLNNDIFLPKSGRNWCRFSQWRLLPSIPWQHHLGPLPIHAKGKDQFCSHHASRKTLDCWGKRICM